MTPNGTPRNHADEIANARFAAMCRKNYDAFTAMRNDINSMIGEMASSESTLASGPEMTHECAAVTDAVAKYVASTAARVEAAVLAERDRCARLVWMTEMLWPEDAKMLANQIRKGPKP
jgi:hypothetical protein